jgi:hypothetical protein
VNIPDESQQVLVFVAQDGFVTIFKEMPGAAMAAVKILSVPREKLSHDGGNPLLAAFEEEMNVIVHKHPGVDRAFSLDDVLAEPLKEQSFVLVILEDIGFVNPANHYAVQGVGSVQAGSARHGVTLSDSSEAVKPFST